MSSMIIKGPHSSPPQIYMYKQFIFSQCGPYMKNRLFTVLVRVQCVRYYPPKINNKLVVVILATYISYGHMDSSKAFLAFWDLWIINSTTQIIAPRFPTHLPFRPLWGSRLLRWPISTNLLRHRKRLHGIENSCTEQKTAARNRKLLHGTESCGTEQKAAARTEN